MVDFFCRRRSVIKSAGLFLRNCQTVLFFMKNKIEKIFLFPLLFLLFSASKSRNKNLYKNIEENLLLFFKIYTGKAD